MATDLFVGRERELARLREAFDAAGGDARVVMLAGEPGIGKTRLAEELAAYALERGALVLWGRAQEFAGTPPYWPWVQVGRAYRAAAPAEVRREEWAPYAVELQRIFPGLRDLFPDLAEPTQGESPEAQFRLFDAMSGFLRDVSHRVPLLLVLDDLHWADRSTLLMLTHVARELPGARLLVLGAYRDTDLDRAHPLAEVLATLNRERLFERIHLYGLSEQEASAYVRQSTGAEPHPELLARIYRETEGNPFFLAEIAQVVGQGALSDGAALAIPEGIREALGRRFNRLSREANELLALAAVIGREFDEQLLAALTRHEDSTLLDLLDEARNAHIVDDTGSTGEYRFTHALMRETLLADLSPSRRVRLHAQIAEALEHLADGATRQHAAEFAAHYVESAVLDRDHAEQAAHYSRLAAEQAQAQLAWAEAIHHYERCLELVTAHEDRLGQDEAALWLELGLCRLIEARDGSDAIDRAFTLWPTGDPLGLAHGLLRTFRLPIGALVRQCMPAINRALAQLGPEPRRETCDLLAWKAGVLRGPEADGAAEQADVMARALGLEGERYPLLLRMRPALVMRDEGRLIEGEATLRRLADELRRSALLRGPLQYLAFMQTAIGDLEQAARTVHLMVELIREERFFRDAQAALAWVACLEWRKGRVNSAETILEQMPRDLAPLVGRWLREEMLLVSGDPGRALAQVDLQQSDWLPYLQAERLGARCRLLALSGQRATALSVFREWEVAFERVYEPHLADYLYALHTLDDVLCEFADEGLLHRVQRRLGELHEARNWFLGSGLDYLRGAIELRLGDPDAAERWFETGLGWATREGAPLVAGRCLQGLAAVAELRGDPATARKHLGAAAKHFTAIGAKLYLDQVNAAQGRLAPRRAGRAHYPDGLTEREVEVLRLIAAGKSNRQIAEALVISLHTVGRHVNHIYAKAGVANRAEAAAYALRHQVA